MDGDRIRIEGDNSNAASVILEAPANSAAAVVVPRGGSLGGLGGVTIKGEFLNPFFVCSFLHTTLIKHKIICRWCRRLAGRKWSW